VSSNIGDLQNKLGRYDEAEVLFRNLLPRARETFPAGHILLGIVLSRYGESLLRLERYEQAKPVLQEGHSLLLASLGADHRHTKNAARLLADLKATQGRTMTDGYAQPSAG